MFDPPSPSPTPRSQTPHSRQSSLTSPIINQPTIQVDEEERDRRAEQSLMDQIGSFNLNNLDYVDYVDDDYSVEFGRNDFGYTPSKGSESHPTGNTPLKFNQNLDIPQSSSRAMLTKELDKLISNKPIQPSPFNPSRFGGSNFDDRTMDRSIESARIPDMTGLTFTSNTPERFIGNRHKTVSSKRTKLGREDEEVILNSITNLEVKLNTLNDENLQSRKRVRELELELESARVEIMKAKTLKSNDLSEWQEKFKNLLDEKNSLEDLTRNLKNVVENLKSQVSTQSKTIEDLRSDKVNNQSKLEDKDREITWLNGQVNKLNNEVESLWRNINDNKERVQQSERDEEEQERLRNQRQRLKDQREQLELQTLRERERERERERSDEQHYQHHQHHQHHHQQSEENDISPPKLVLRPFGAHLKPDKPQSFFSPTRDRAARSHPSTNPNVTQTPAKTINSEDKKENNENAVKQSSNNNNVDERESTPKLSKRTKDSLTKTGMYWTLPSSVTKSSRRASSGAIPPTPTNVANVENKVSEDNFIESLVERVGKSSSGWESKVPPQTVLARVVREIEDDFNHFKGIYNEMSDQFKLLDPASNSAKRRVLTQHLHQVINVLETKVSI